MLFRGSDSNSENRHRLLQVGKWCKWSLAWVQAECQIPEIRKLEEHFQCYGLHIMQLALSHGVTWIWVFFSDITACFMDGISLQHLVTRIRTNSQKTFEAWITLKSLLWFSSEHQKTASFCKKSLADGQYSWNVNTAVVTSAHKITYRDRPYSYSLILLMQSLRLLPWSLSRYADDF